VIENLTYIDDFFRRKKYEINIHFGKYISYGFSKKLMRGSTAKDLFEIAIKDYFKQLNEELVKELSEFEYKNKFENSLECYERNIIEVKEEFLKYLDKSLCNFIRTHREMAHIYQVLNTEVNDSIKKWGYIVKKKEKPKPLPRVCLGLRVWKSKLS
jgi:hypothetical protein